ncbi:hypothetical protein GCM10009414_07290 [Tatumella terrea]
MEGNVTGKKALFRALTYLSVVTVITPDYLRRIIASANVEDFSKLMLSIGPLRAPGPIPDLILLSRITSGTDPNPQNNKCHGNPL